MLNADFSLKALWICLRAQLLYTMTNFILKYKAAIYSAVVVWKSNFYWFSAKILFTGSWWSWLLLEKEARGQLDITWDNLPV